MQITAGKKRFSPSTIGPFVVQRPRAVRVAILQLHAVSLHLSAGTLRNGAVQVVDVTAARGAHVTAYAVVYGTHGTRADFFLAGSATSDSDGYATLRFRVSYRPPRHTRVRAELQVTATQGRARATATARFYVQG